MNYNIAILPGDGIGPEIMKEGLKVLDKISTKFHHNFKYSKALIGGSAWQKYHSHFPEETKQICKQSDAILFGCVGGPVDSKDKKWINVEKNAILGLRKELELNINLRPIITYPSLIQQSPLKNEIIKNGIDILIIRELIGGIYFGKHKTEQDIAIDIMQYSEKQINKCLIKAFEFAQKRNHKLTVVDKANVLDTSRLWRKTAKNTAKKFPNISLEFMYIDNATMQIIKNPSQFDVIVTSNLFGDILSDAASVIPGSIGLIPSASIGNLVNLYEPISGSAPEIAGLNIANPIALIMSIYMMFKYSFNLNEEAESINKAINKVLKEGYRTQDIADKNSTILTTNDFGNKIIQYI